MPQNRFQRCFGGTAFMTGLCLLTAALAAEPLIFEIVSARPDFDKRTGRPFLSIELKDKRPFPNKLDAEKQVLRTMELRIDGRAALSTVIREPVYTGGLAIWGPEFEAAQESISRAIEAGSRLEIAIVD